MKCENCIYRKNCQFLGKHKKVEVSDCTAFVSETDFVKKAKIEAVREFAEKLKVFLLLSRPEQISAVSYEDIDNLVNKMFGNPEQAEGE